MAEQEGDEPERHEASDVVWAVTDGTALATGAEFFPALVRNLANALKVPYAFVAECTDRTKTRVRTLAFWNRDRLIDNVEYNLNRYILDADQSFIEHWGGAQPWGPSSERWRETSIDFKYDKAQTPRLIEVHGRSRVVMLAEPYVALRTVKVPVEFYVYPDGPHNLRSPSHRLHSLSTNTDWFRFWLQGYEDPTPEKRSQYQRWRKMRLEWETEKAAKSGNY